MLHNYICQGLSRETVNHSCHDLAPPVTRLRIVSLVVGEDYDITKLKLTFVFQYVYLYIYRKFIK